jgi:very-short-patch-repair endonuclease
MPHADIANKHRTNAKRMRRDMTDAERKLWHELRGHRLMGLGFRRQMPIAGYIVDFACPDHRLIVEVDGSQHGHDNDVLYDRVRTARLQADGWMVLRFWNDEILRNINGVCDGIIRTIGIGALK